ncbi:MAG: choice-of-anchor Q domain-containing protein, partial [Verrucomicrobiota bacterium]
FPAPFWPRRQNISPSYTSSVRRFTATTPGLRVYPQHRCASNWEGFGDNDYGDLRLGMSSPAVDIGLNGSNPTTNDLAGAPRVQNLTIDLGAYERASGSPYDLWAQSHGLPPGTNSMAMDPDDDGVSNYEEFIADTIPTNGSSFLRVSIEAQSSHRIIHIGYSSSNRTYTLQWTDDLLNPGWSNVLGQIERPGNDSHADHLMDSTPIVTRRYYRVRVSLP